MAASALLIGFSLVCDERIVMAMVGEHRWMGLSLMIGRSRLENKDELIHPNRAAWPLACLRRGFPIVGVPVHPRGGNGVVGVCCSLLMCV